MVNDIFFLQSVPKKWLPIQCIVKEPLFWDILYFIINLYLVQIFYKFGTGTPVLKRYSAIYRRYQMIHKQSPTPNNSGLYKGSFQKQNKKFQWEKSTKVQNPSLVDGPFFLFDRIYMWDKFQHIVLKVKKNLLSGLGLKPPQIVEFFHYFFKASIIYIVYGKKQRMWC